MADVRSVVESILKGRTPREALGLDDDDTMDEAATYTKKVVRNGKVVKKKFKKHTKRRILSAAQKRAIRKAQQASKKGSAIAKRKKSLRKVAAMEAVDAENENFDVANIICPDCGGALQVSFDEENGVPMFYCPECDSEYSLVNNDTLANMVDLDSPDDEDAEVYIVDDDDEDTDDDMDEGCGDPDDGVDLYEDDDLDDDADDEDPMYFED